MSSGDRAHHENGSPDEATAEELLNLEPDHAAALVMPPPGMRQRLRASTLAASIPRRTTQLLPPGDTIQVLTHLSASPPPPTTTTSQLQPHSWLILPISL